MIATYSDVVSGCQPAHSVDQDRVSAIVDAYNAAGEWLMPPILVVEDRGNGALVLDGHHRAEAAKRIGIDIPAIVVPAAEFEALIQAEFEGELPSRISDLDEYLGYTGRD